MLPTVELFDAAYQQLVKLADEVGDSAHVRVRTYPHGDVWIRGATLEFISKAHGRICELGHLFIAVNLAVDGFLTSGLDGDDAAFISIGVTRRATPGEVGEEIARRTSRVPGVNLTTEEKADADRFIGTGVPTEVLSG